MTIMDYKTLFDDVMYRKYDTTPLSDDEAFIHNIEERARKMEKKNFKFKKPIAIAASVAAAAALTVSAGAALNWDFGAAFGGIFNKAVSEPRDVIFIDADNAPDTQITQNDDVFRNIDGSTKIVTVENTYRNYGFDYNKYGKELDLSFDGDGFTVNYKGIMGEGRVMYLLYDVVFDAESDYTPKDGYTDWEPVFEYDTTDGLGRAMDNKLIHSDGNIYSYYGKLIAEDDMSGNILTIKGSGLWRERFKPLIYDMDETDFERLKCDFYTEIPIDMENDVPEKTVKPNEPIKVYDLIDGKLEAVDTMLYDIKITPFTCTFSFCQNGKVFGKAECYDIDPLTFTFSDGTELIQGASSYETNSETDTETVFIEFDQPVEPDDIVSLMIDGKTIPLA